MWLWINGALRLCVPASVQTPIGVETSRSSSQSETDLVAKRYLLPEDAALLVDRAESEGIRSGP
jgi:hypothetical protein